MIAQAFLSYNLGMSKSKNPRDPNQLAKSIVDIATGNSTMVAESSPSNKNPAAVELGRLGGLKGGKARAMKLSKQRRSEIARKAALTRWEKLARGD